MTAEVDPVEARPAAVARPRALDASTRARLGIFDSSSVVYPWPSAVIATLVFGVPLVVAGRPALAAFVALAAVVVLPTVRAYERRALATAERIYRDGDEVVARVTFVEPPGPGRRDHAVGVEYFAGEGRVTARIVGSPLARRGLRPGDDVVAYVDPAAPTRVLLVGKIARTPHVRAARRDQRANGAGGASSSGPSGASAS